MRYQSLFQAAVCALLLSGPALAADSVKVSLQAFKVTLVNGQESLVESKTVKPGDVLEYRAVYSNVSKKNVTGLAASLPVPAGMEYVARSAMPAGVQASVDGKVFAPAPLMRKKADGKTDEPVPVAEYRALRWTASALQPGKEFTVMARMRVSAK